METEIVIVDKPAGVNVILGHSHFIKTVEDLYEALVTAVPHIKFGVAFCEASGDRLIRFDGTDEELTRLAVEAAQKIGAGHSFVVMLSGVFPINVLDRVKSVQEVCRIFAATANPLQVIVAVTDQGRAILGVVDGEPPLGVEDEDKKQARKDLLRKFGYKR